MKAGLLLIVTLVLAMGPASGREVDSRPELVNVSDLAAPNADPLAVPADTTWILGGPGTLTGKFEDAMGQPDWQGWTSIDLTQPTEHHWSVSTFNAANLDTIADNHAWWCGDIFEACAPNDPPEGVGNNWYELLTWSGAVPDPASDCTVRVRAILNSDLEPAYDFLYLQVITEPYPLNLDEFWSTQVGYEVDVSHVATPADYVDGAIQLRWLVVTDGAFSDEDSLWPSAGGCQIDNTIVTFDQGAGEQMVGTVETCEPGTPLQWIPTVVPGVGDYAQVWPILEDLDPDADNATPQVAFIDDGEVEPASDGSPCITWCYGPGGFIVPPGHGLAETHVGIDNEIWSPALPLPPAGIAGALLAFDVYVHSENRAGTPRILPTWHLRSTDDPTGNDGWSEWRTHGISLWGGPDYARPVNNVTDLLVPDATYVQISLGAYNYYHSGGDDGTPAPYFDNVAFMVHDDPSPTVFNVRADGAGDFPTIQEAVFAAASGDTILLADGVYTGGGNRDLSFLGKNIVIASASGDPGVCIIDAEGSDADRHRVFYLTNVGGPGSVVAGVTLRGGAERYGGGVYVNRSGLTLERCVLEQNLTVGWGRNGGAIYGTIADLVIRDCTFVDNEADRGAAIACATGVELEVSGSVFRGNKALDQGSGIWRGHGNQITVDGCTFVDNREQLNQGVIVVYGPGLARFRNTIIAFTQLGSAFSGGEGAEPDFACCDLFDNWNGDWTGLIADQLGVDGNFSADPLFCLDEQPDDPYTIDTGSPCAPEHQPTCGLIGARPVACDSSLDVPDGEQILLATRLLPPSPNPFNPRTRIRFELAAPGRVEVAIFDLRGRRVRSLVAGDLPAGAHERAWDGHTDEGRAAASGTYLVRMLAAGRVECRRLSLLK